MVAEGNEFIKLSELGGPKAHGNACKEQGEPPHSKATFFMSYYLPFHAEKSGPELTYGV
jgi:hypothetical protein